MKAIGILIVASLTFQWSLHNTNTYYFERNILGDVLGIYDLNGNLKVKYLYDAYGNCTVSNETTDQQLAKVNPIRYRGYYYDVETGLFWISSRYYNPEWGRYIQPADISSLNSQLVNGLNLYCFLNNNPLKINFKKESTAKENNKFDFIQLPTKPIDKPSRWSTDWFVTDVPVFFKLTNSGFRLVDWSLNIFQAKYLFNENRNEAFLINVGNISAYAGFDYEKGIGLDASASLIEFVFDSRTIDFGVEFISFGYKFYYNNGKYEGKAGFGWYGITISIDFIELVEWLKERGL